MSCSLSKLICKHYDLPTDSSQFKTVYRASLRYLIRAMDSREFQATLVKVTGVTKRDFRLALTNSGYYTLNLKMHVITSASCKADPKLVAASLATHKILKADRVALAHFYADGVIRKHVLMIKREFGGTIPTMAQIQSRLAWLLSRLDRHMNGIVFKRMRFIVGSTDLDYADLKVELKAKLIQTYYWTMPRNRSVAHLVASTTQSLNNTAVNMIQYYTAGKRARIVRNEKMMFEYVEVGFDTSTKDSGHGDPLPHKELAVDHSHLSLEGKIAVQQLVANFAVTAKKSLILKLFMGIHDSEFTEFLRDNRLIGKVEDNTDFQEAVPQSEFIQKVAEFAEVTRKFIRKFLELMQSALNGQEVDYASAA